MIFIKKNYVAKYKIYSLIHIQINRFPSEKNSLDLFKKMRSARNRPSRVKFQSKPIRIRNNQNPTRIEPDAQKQQQKRNVSTRHNPNRESGRVQITSCYPTRCGALVTANGKCNHPNKRRILLVNYNSWHIIVCMEIFTQFCYNLLFENIRWQLFKQNYKIINSKQMIIICIIGSATHWQPSNRVTIFIHNNAEI